MATAVPNRLNGSGVGNNGSETGNDLVRFVGTLKGQVDAALPPLTKKVLTPERMIRLAMTALRQVRNLDKCTPESIAGGLMVASQLGLEPCTPLQQCYLIPRWNSYKNCYEATFQIGYQGMLALAYRSDQIISVHADVVHDNDEFYYERGLNESLIHRPYMGGDRGEVRAFYAIARYKSGGHNFEVESLTGMIAHRDRHAPRDKKTNQITGPWLDNFESMAKKTMIRRLFTFMPKSTDQSRAIAFDDRVSLMSSADEEPTPQIEQAWIPPQETRPEIIHVESVEVQPEPEVKATKKPAKKADPAPEPEPVTEQPAAEPPFDYEQPAVESVNDKIKKLDAWAERAAKRFEEKGQPTFGHPGKVIEEVYAKFVQTGLVPPGANSYRDRTKAIAGIEESWAIIIDNLKAFTAELYAELEQPPAEPGSEG